MANPLASYPVRRPAPVAPEVRDMLAEQRELLAQAEALRQDFPMREAKLRQAADIADATHLRADNLRVALADGELKLTKAFDLAASANAEARGLRSELTTYRNDLLEAHRVALGVRSEWEEVRQNCHSAHAQLDTFHHQADELTQLIEGLKNDLREAIIPRAAPLGLDGVPGDVPGTQLTAVPTMYPAGPTDLGFLYGQITATDITTGITLSGGTSFLFTETAAARSGAVGLFLNKPKTNTTNSHSLVFEVGGNPLWEWGVDFNTNNSVNGGTGGSYLACFDHTANANAGADIIQISLAENDSVSTTAKATKFQFTGVGGGSPKDNTHLMTINTNTAVDLGGFSATIKSQNARDHITLVNAHATSKRNVINFGGFWKMGSDIGGAGTSEFILRDNTNSLNRLYLENTSALLAKMGLNTTNPLGNFHSATSNDASLFDTPQIGLVVGYSTLANRSVNITQILDASQARNMLWLMGTLGSGSTQVTPTSTSTSTKAHAIGSQQNTMTLWTAPSGTNQTLLPAVAVTNDGTVAQVGLFGATPVGQAANTADLRTALINLGVIASGGANPLNTNNGAVTCGALTASTGSFTGAIGGSGTNFQLNRQTFTFAADADETLDATHAAAVILDVQAGVISTTRKIKWPGTNAGTTVFVINRNANAVQIGIGANTYITVASARAALICMPGGTNAFRLTPDTDYTL